MFQRLNVGKILLEVQDVFSLEHQRLHCQFISCFFIDALTDNSMSSFSCFLPKIILLMKERRAGVLIIRVEIIKINRDALPIVNGGSSMFFLYFFLEPDRCGLNCWDILQTHADVGESLLPAIFLFHDNNYSINT